MIYFMPAPGTPTPVDFIPEDLQNEIRDRTDIVQIIGEYVQLRPSGRSYKALCPFHPEKTPSFFVLPDKQIFHCYGCNKGGNVFRFIMDSEHLTFPEAIRYLASRCGVTIPEKPDPANDEKKFLLNILHRASEYFVANLNHPTHGAEARAYLKTRGIKPETIDQFRIGYALDQWDALTNTLGVSAATTAVLQSCGLGRERPNASGSYDMFRHRLMVPICDRRGRVVAFGGRVLRPDDQPKYLNSPEHSVFSKRNLLFNFQAALPQIRRLNSALVVEGYLDVISLWQHGIRNVVATLGTAISAEHVQTLARNCETIYFCYDGDEAGQRATLRAISMQRDTPVVARIVAFPDHGDHGDTGASKDDPDSFVRREGAEAFNELLANAVDIYAFLINSRTRGLTPPLEISVKEQLLKDMHELIPDIHSPLARSEVIKTIARLLDTDENALERHFRSASASRTARRPATAATLTSAPTIGNAGVPAAGTNTATTARATKAGSAAKPTGGAPLRRQEWILKHLIENPQELERVRAWLGPEDFADPRLQAIFRAFAQQQEAHGGELKPAQFITTLQDPDLSSRLSELIVTLEEKPEEPFMECVKGLALDRLKRESAELQRQIRQVEQRGDETEVARLTMMQLDIRRKIEHLNRNC